MYNYSPYIKENLEFLQKLAKTRSDRKKNTILINASADQILAIVEICANILKFNFTLTKRQKRKLIKFADFYRTLARTRSEKTARRKLQEGSGIAIGTLLIPVLTTLASHLIEKISQ